MDKLKQEIKSVISVYKSGNLLEAEQKSRNLIKENPKVVFLYNLLGLILSGQKKFAEAIDIYNQGIKIDPGFAIIYNNLGLIYFNIKSDKNIIKAEQLYKKAISLDSSIPEAHTNLGNLYNFLNKTEESVKSHKKAISINSKFPYPYLNLANVYIANGEFEEAEKNLKEAIKLNSEFYYAHRLLSRIIKYNEGDDHLVQLEKLYNTNIANSESKMHIAFALGKAFEDTKDFDKSFYFYKEANKISRNKTTFSINNEKSRFDEIKKIFNTNLFDEFKNRGHPDSSIIFIVGMPRSGTTLVEQILSSHSDVFGADEVEFIPDLFNKNFFDNNLKLSIAIDSILNDKNLKNIGKEYILKMNKISNDARIKTDKLPSNFLFIGFIKLILPNSKIIHCYRNPRDNIASIFKNYFTGGKINYAYNLNEIVEYYNLYSDLIKYWNIVLPGFIYNIEYEKLIADTESQIKKALNFCNLEWQDNCLKFYSNKRPIRTASDTQARKKIYTSSINSWKNYEKYLKEYMDKIKD